MYLDDILVFSRTLKDHMHTLERIFKRLEENGLAISLKKCRFGEQSIEFVGYNISREGVQPLPRKLHAISSFPAPQKQKHLLGFLGTINYYRRSLPQLKGKTAAEILQPLYTAATKQLQRKSFVAHWQENDLDKAFGETKELLMKAVELVHPDTSAPIALTTDASKTAIGGVL